MAGRARVAVGASLETLLLQIVHDSNQEMQDQLEDIIQGLGPSVFPDMRQLLDQRNLVPAALCGLAQALGAAGDGASGPKLLRLLSHPSRRVQVAAAQALRDLGDLIIPHLAAVSSTGPSNTKTYAQLLLTVMEGKPLPKVPDLVRQLHEGERSSLAVSAEDEDSEMLRASFAEHLHELVSRFVKAASVASAAALAGAALAPSLGPAAVAALYGLSPSAARACLPDGYLLRELFAILLAAWVGLPALGFQAWRFVSVGLYRTERFLTALLVALSFSLVALSPMLIFMVSRALAKANLLWGLHLADSISLVRLTNRLSIVTALLLAWIFGFKRIWKWLAQVSRAYYALELAGSEQHVASPRRLLLWLTCTTTILIPLLPVHTIGTLLLGFFMYGLAFHTFGVMLLREIEIGSPPLKGPLFAAGFGEGFASAILPRLLILVACPLIWGLLIVFPTEVRHVLQNMHLEPAELQAPSSEAMARWVLIHTAWGSVALASLLETLFWLTRWLKRGGVQKPLAELTGRVVALLVILAPGPLTRLGSRFVNLLADSRSGSSHDTAYLAVHLSVLVTFLMILLAAYCSTRYSAAELPLRRLTPLLRLIATAALLPTPVLAAAFVLPSACIVLLLPTAIDFLLTPDPGPRLAAGLDEFRTESRRLRETFEREISNARSSAHSKGSTTHPAR